MGRERVMAGTYVLAAGLLLALGATAHYAEVGTREPAPTRSTAQMGQGMMGQNMAAARETGSRAPNHGRVSSVRSTGNHASCASNVPNPPGEAPMAGFATGAPRASAPEKGTG